MASSSKAAPAKRRSPAQIAADAQKAYRAQVERQRNAAEQDAARCRDRAANHAAHAHAQEMSAAVFERQATEYSAELKRIDAAVAVLAAPVTP